MKLYRNGGWQKAENERAFLARAAWRVAVDHRRSARAAETVTDAEPQVDPASSQPGPEQALVAANQHALIHAMIDALPEELRLPLVLSASGELNSREIAAKLNMRNIPRNQETQHA